jgi:hypothetical protein
MRVTARKIRHEADAARVVLESRVVQRRALRQRKPALDRGGVCDGCRLGRTMRIKTGSCGGREECSRIHIVCAPSRRMPQQNSSSTIRELTNHTNRNFRHLRNEGQQPKSHPLTAPHPSILKEFQLEFTLTSFF